LNTTYTNILRYGLFLVINVNFALSWILFAIGLFGLGVTLYILGTDADTNVASVAKEASNGDPLTEDPEKESVSVGHQPATEISAKNLVAQNKNQTFQRQQTLVNGKIENVEKSLHM
jgi:hypothetical protein